MNREGTTFHLDLSSIGAEPLDPEDPRQIGAFPICAVLGSGGMGRVYLGVAPDGYTAVKRVLPQLANDRTFLRHFGQELDNQARLPSGVSARLLAADRTARPPWFATEYIPGVTLHDSVYLNGGSLPTDTVWVLLRELATRLKAIAALEMVHRDLKPSNVMLTGSGVTLIDFGIARAADQSTVTATGMIVGTPAYMAPEQARAQKSLTPAVDVFSLGGVLAYAATGEPAFGGGSGTDLLFRIVHEAPDLDTLRALDAELAGVIESCLAKDPAARPSADELAEIAAAHAQPGPPTWPTTIDQLIAARRTFAQTAPGSEPSQAPARVSTSETEFEEPGGESVVGAGVEAGARVEVGVGVEAGVGAGVAAVEVPELEPDPAEAADPDFVKTVPVASGRSERGAKHEGERKRRKAMASLLTLLVLVGTAGTLIAMHKVPFISSAGPNTLGGGYLNPTGTGGWSTATSHASASSGSSAAAGSATTSTKANPSGSSSASSGSGSGNSGSTSGSSGNNSGGTTTTTTGAAVTTHTSTSGSGGSGGSGTSYATVVSTTDSEIENVAAQVCVSGFSGQGTRSCDGSNEAAFHEVSASGGFQLVSPVNTCLYNDYSTSSTVYAFSCQVLDPTTEVWTLGTRTSKGGELINKGMCLAYSSAVQGNLTLASCNSSDSNQLWYDAGAA